ncbi:MAG: hypothetical protein DRJ51_07065 [Thermoprotei archaeon]|nr:MAG: hypothetical protein DRJ51_07065 [Thermoprotei archaeon]
MLENLVYYAITAIIGYIIGVFFSPLREMVKKKLELNARSAEDLLQVVYRPLYRELSAIRSGLSSPSGIWFRIIDDERYLGLLIDDETRRALRGLVAVIKEYNAQMEVLRHILSGILTRRLTCGDLFSIRKRMLVTEHAVGRFSDLLDFFLSEEGIFGELLMEVLSRGGIESRWFKVRHSDFIRDLSVVAQEIGLSDGEKLVKEILGYVNSRLADEGVARVVRAARELRAEIVRRIERCQELLERDMERIRRWPFWYGVKSYTLIERLKSEQEASGKLRPLRGQDL